MNDFLTDPRFAGIEPFKNKIWLSSPTMHGEELEFVREAIETRVCFQKHNTQEKVLQIKIKSRGEV